LLEQGVPREDVQRRVRRPAHNRLYDRRDKKITRNIVEADLDLKHQDVRWNAMPKRTNDFQKLIFLIEQQLAPHGAIVRESPLLRDHRTGNQREIDILIETRSGLHPLSIAIECIDHKRPAPVTWVEQIQQKHADVPVNKTILVSRSGFSKAALLKAHAFNMEAIPIREALAANWVRVANRLGLLDLTTWVRTPINVKMNFVSPAPSDLDLAQLTIHAPTGELLGDPRTVLLGSFFPSPEVQEIENALADCSSTLVRGSLVFPPGTYGADGAGNTYEFRSWAVEATITKASFHVPLKNASYTSATIYDANCHHVWRTRIP
jgi:hypothetical protein